MHLYELAEQYNTLLDTQDMTDEQIVEHLDNIQAQFSDKVINTGKVVLTLKAMGKAIESEMSRLAERQNSIRHKVEWLESYLLDNMTLANQQKIEGDVLTVSIRNNPPSIKVIDQEQIPVRFQKRIPETWQVDKVSILKNFKETGEIPNGVEVVTTNKSVVIK